MSLTTSTSSSDTAVVTATLDEDERYDDEDEGDDVVLHCGAELPGDEQMAQHLLTHTLSWYKIPNSLVTARNSAASGGDEDAYGASASSSGLKKDLQLQVPDFHNLDDISFYVGSEEAKERERLLRRKRMRRNSVSPKEATDRRSGVSKNRRRNKRHLGGLFPFAPFSFASSASSSSYTSSSSSAAIANVFRRHLAHHNHFGGNGGGGGAEAAEITRDALVLSYSQYPTLNFEKLAVKKDTEKFGLAKDNSSLTISGVEEADFGIYVCQVDLHYIPIPPAPQNLHKAVTVELRRKIEA